MILVSINSLLSWLEDRRRVIEAATILKFNISYIAFAFLLE